MIHLNDLPTGAIKDIRAAHDWICEVRRGSESPPPYIEWIECWYGLNLVYDSCRYKTYLLYLSETLNNRPLVLYAAQIAGIFGYSKVTVCKAIQHLLERNILWLSGAVNRGKGHPARAISVSLDTAWKAYLDVCGDVCDLGNVSLAEDLAEQRPQNSSNTDFSDEVYRIIQQNYPKSIGPTWEKKSYDTYTEAVNCLGERAFTEAWAAVNKNLVRKRTDKPVYLAYQADIAKQAYDNKWITGFWGNARVVEMNRRYELVGAIKRVKERQNPSYEYVEETEEQACPYVFEEEDAFDEAAYFEQYWDIYQEVGDEEMAAYKQDVVYEYLTIDELKADSLGQPYIYRDERSGIKNLWIVQLGEERRAFQLWEGATDKDAYDHVCKKCLKGEYFVSPFESTGKMSYEQAIYTSLERLKEQDRILGSYQTSLKEVVGAAQQQTNSNNVGIQEQVSQYFGALEGR